MRTLCLGEALVDLICCRPVASMAEADAFVPHFGGATANVAVGAARAGADVALAGAAGDDPWGAWLRERLAREGVALDWFELVPGMCTSVAFVTVDEHAEPTFTLYGESIEETVGAIAGHLDAAVDGCEALFLSTNSMVGEDEARLTLQARDRALAQGKPFVFDPNLRLRRWADSTQAVWAARECMKGSFLVKCNRAEARLITGEEEPEAAAASLLAAGAEHAVITLGAGGAILRGRGMRRNVPGRAAQVVDTTGAGDAFMGVVIGRLGATEYYASAIAAALPDAVEEGTRTCERWGALPAPGSPPGP